MALQTQLQQIMNDLVGIIRADEEMRSALERLDELKDRARNLAVEGNRQFNPGWHLALDLRNMLLVSECVARAAVQRTESRGGHTRDDHPEMDPQWRSKLLVCTRSGEGVQIAEKRQPPLRADLAELFELAELRKYCTEDELPGPQPEPVGEDSSDEL